MFFLVRLPGEGELKVRRLGWTEEALIELPTDELLIAVRHRRALIRWHREQRGDDRCWLDDWVVHLALSDTQSEPAKLPEEAMQLCEEFFERRQAPEDPIDQGEFTAAQRQEADSLLEQMLQDRDGGRKFLIRELLMLQIGILGHRLEKPRNWIADQQLYLWLPEQRLAVTRLPSREEFLAVQPGAAHGCPQFIASHADCPIATACDLHRWGPCGRVARMVELLTG